jgi:NAD(P)-dependent dehydrogenase (short-subunit alcohol dehydrogenase family)
MIIITGASGGVGSAILKNLFVTDKIIGLYNTNKPAATNKDILYEKVDLHNEDQIIKFIDKYREELLNITLIHCAAVKSDKLMLNLSSSDWESVFNVNVKGVFLLTKHILKIMIGDQWGRVIHLSSKGGEVGDIGTAAYSSSKTALFGMSKVLSREYASFGITSNVISLGAFNTGLYTALSNKLKKEILEKIPSKEVGDIINISNAIKFIINSDYVNGSVITIDGGV